MKKFCTLIATIASLCLTSCQQALSPQDDAVIITASFQGTMTKSTLVPSGENLFSGTPTWSAGDEIWLSDGTQIAKVTVEASDDGKARFSFVKPATFEGSTIYAVYPYSSGVGVEDGTVLFSVPEVQDGTFAQANICVAVTDGYSLEFRNETPILAFESIDAQVRRITIPRMGISGVYKVSKTGDSAERVSGKEVNHVTLSTLVNDTVNYLAVGPVSIVQGTNFRIEDADGTILGTKATTDHNGIEKSKIYNLGEVKASDFVQPEDMLPSAFSISATRKVHFSKGNLKYQLTGTPGWGFFNHQYDCDPCTNYESSTDYVSLFYWACTESSNKRDHVDYTDRFWGTYDQDWGVHVFPYGTWRTLTKDEWDYLLNERSMKYGKPRYSNMTGGVTIESVSRKGLFLYPDNYNGDEVSSTMTWAEINAAGIVFLPSAGMRQDRTMMYGMGNYWTFSQAEGSKAYILEFHARGVSANETADRSKGFAVRLVAD